MKLESKSKTICKLSKLIRALIIVVIIGVLLSIILYGVICFGIYGDGFDNSVYSSQFFKDKTIMVIVPHEDDEINVAGATIKSYVDGGSNVIIVFTTNGDYYGLGELRINEAISAMTELGVEKENVIFLGYGDQWDTEYKHIYNAPKNEVVKSYIGKTSTYGNDDVVDFRTIISGESSTYTRDNYKKDMKAVILSYLPDSIFTVDFDSHIDHRATSLIFEEALGEILKKTEDYKPKVFKGFAYNTAWNAERDFYAINLESTLIPNEDMIQNGDYELDIPNYNWEDRIRFLVPKDTLTYTQASNPIYKALSKHKSQQARLQSERIINSDQVFWERSTKSITYNATIEVSSGEPSYINDFKLVDSSDISKVREVYFDRYIWTPSEYDDKKAVKIIFDESKDVSSVSIYDNLSLEDNILKGKLVFSDGSEIDVTNIKKNGSETKITFESKSDVEYIEFYIVEYEGDEPGLCELEVYNEVNDMAPEYIKLTVDDSKETFMYRYTIMDEDSIPLKVYSYPNTEGNDISDRCNIYIVEGKEQLKLENNTLKISDNARVGVYKVRVELIDNPDIFDEVEIIIPNKFQELYVKYIDDCEKLFLRIYASLRYRLGIDR